VTAGLFLLVPFFHPLLKMIGGGVAVGNGVTLHPIVAPALVLVGVVMMRRRHADSLGRLCVVDSRVPHDRGHSADGEHHRRDCIRIHRGSGSRLGHRPASNAPSLGVPVRRALRHPIRFEMAC
jgi:hypothetical protein